MSSGDEEAKELKAGHPPAVKVGGMRITQHKPTHPPEKAPEKKDAEEGAGDEEAEGEDVATTDQRQNLVISGAPARGDADFPPEAIKAFHEKPIPSHDFRSGSGGKPNIINQPRKQN